MQITIGKHFFYTILLTFRQRFTTFMYKYGLIQSLDLVVFETKTKSILFF